MKWHLPDIKEKSEPQNFSWWVYILVSILGYLALATSILLINPKITDSAIQLLLYLVIGPLCCALSFAGLLYSLYDHNLVEAKFFNHFIKRKQHEWHQWAGQYVALVNYTYLTDIDDAALKIVGLEGEAPMNPEKVIPISALYENYDAPIVSALNSILTPLNKDIIAKSSSITVLLNSTSTSETETRKAFDDYCQFNDISIL